MKRSDIRNVRRDAAAATAMVLMSLLILFITYDALAGTEDLDDAPRPAVSVLMVLALMAPLAFRRRHPTTVGLLVTGCFIVFRVIGVPEGTMSSVALFVAIYTVGAWAPTAGHRLWGRTVAIVASVGVLLWSILSKTDYVNTDALIGTAVTVTLNAAFFVTAWMMGDLARNQRESEAELARRAEELAVEREERARRAVVDERVRIARELHDVVAHHVSVMGVQAGAARRVLAGDPAAAAEALASIEQSGRQAVGELQRLVGFLRSGDEGDLVEPQPTIDDIQRLVDRTRAAGLPVGFRRIGKPRAVPDAVELSAYRIIQEALTNTLKHAGQVPTTVVLTYGPDHVQVEVVNRRGDLRPSPGGGRGLLGMRERASMVNGTFESGATADGGYRVSARLPTATAYRTEARHP